MIAPSFGVSRTFDTTLSRLWAAFTNAGTLVVWGPPPGAKVLTLDIDPVVGGTCRLGIELPDETEVWGAWEIHRVVPDALVAFTFTFMDDRGRPSRPRFNREWPLRLRGEIRCALQGGGATVTVNLTPIEPDELQAATFRRGFAAMSEEWERALNRLDAAIATRGDDGS